MYRVRNGMGGRVRQVKEQLSELEQMPDWSWNPARRQWWGGAGKKGISTLNEAAEEVKTMLRETQGGDLEIRQVARDLVRLAQDKLGYRNVPPSQLEVWRETQSNVADITARLKYG